MVLDLVVCIIYPRVDPASISWSLLFSELPIACYQACFYAISKDEIGNAEATECGLRGPRGRPSESCSTVASTYEDYGSDHLETR